MSLCDSYLRCFRCLFDIVYAIAYTYDTAYTYFLICDIMIGGT